MNKRVRVIRLATGAAAACAAFVLLAVPVVRTATVSILDPVVDSAVGSNSALRAALNAPTGKRSRLVRVNLSPLPSPGTGARLIEDDLELELFADITVKAVFERFETVGGSGTWVGHVDGIPMSSVTLAYRDGLMTASINTRDAVFQIRPAPDTDQGDDARRLHIVSEVDTEVMPHGPDTPGVSGDAQSSSPTVSAAPERLTDSGDVIDLMVVYTPAALAYAGGPAGIANLIALGVSDTNSAYANSRVNQRIRLVHSALVPFTETNSGFKELDELRRGVGELSGVAALRNAYGADLVMLVPYAPVLDRVCGVGYLSTEPPTFGESWGFSLSFAQCVVGGYTFAHELGHNMGAHHDWYVDRTPTFGHGHVDVAQRWRTVMAYDDMCRDQGFTCPTLNYFSTPEVEYIRFCSGRTFNCDLLRYWFYPGTRLGVGAGGPTNCRLGVVPSSYCEADNRRMFNDTAVAIANYRQSR